MRREGACGREELQEDRQGGPPARESANYYWFKDTFMVFKKIGSDHLSGGR